MDAVLKRVINKKGYVKVKEAPYKRYAHYLTPKGFQEKSRLVSEYLKMSLDFFRTARADYSRLFERANAQGYNSFMFAGDGELVEIAYLAARENEVEIIGIYDRSANASQKYGLNVIKGLEEVIDQSMFVLTESRSPQSVFDELASVQGGDKILAPPYSEIGSKYEYWQGQGLLDIIPDFGSGIA